MSISRKKVAPKRQLPTGQTTTEHTPTVIDAVPRLVSAELLSVRTSNTLVLINHIDNIKSATYDTAGGELALSFHLLVAYSDAPIEKFAISICRSGKDFPTNQILPTTNIPSPGLGTNHPATPWASQSRFTVDTTIRDIKLVPGELLLISGLVNEEQRPIARVFITSTDCA